MTHPPVLVLDLRYLDPGYVGEIPNFLDVDDPRPAAEQFQERYVYGGWRPQEGFTAINGTPILQYPGDPPLEPIACMALREELIFVYRYAYVSIFQKDGSFEACRMD
jgi:hypothetical protein